jgi:hypothetical protein
VKILLVGEENVGKTSIAKFLVTKTLILLFFLSLSLFLFSFRSLVYSSLLSFLFLLEKVSGVPVSTASQLLSTNGIEIQEWSANTSRGWRYVCSRCFHCIEGEVREDKREEWIYSLCVSLYRLL